MRLLDAREAEEEALSPGIAGLDLAYLDVAVDDHFLCLSNVRREPHE
jgi:hypothetical protein